MNLGSAIELLQSLIEKRDAMWGPPFTIAKLVRL